MSAFRLPPTALARTGAILAAILFSSTATAQPAPAAMGGLVRMDEMGRGALLLRTLDPRLFLPAPEVETDATITVSGIVARARVRQRFVNPSELWLEGVYVFPLPEDAAVDRFRLIVDDRVVEGQIQEREQARRTYETAKQAGQRAGLVEQERPNIFTVSVANLAPGKAISVELEYQQPIVPTDGRYAVRFPMVVAPRYMPPPAMATVTTVAATPDAPADRISPPVAPPALQSAGETPKKVRLPVHLSVQLDAGFAVAELKSPYHDVEVEQEGERRFAVTLRDGEVPADRDFVLEWTPEPDAAPQASVFTETVDGDTYLLAMVVPPIQLDAQRPRRPREIVFIIDVSGSMHGPSLAQAKQALTRSLMRLAPSDRFNLIAFSDRAWPLYGKAAPVSEQSLADALDFVADLEAEGGTEMSRALSLALDGGDDPARLRQVVLLTDGAVGNEAELFRLINQGLGDNRLFTVGIGSAPNGYFMRKAAQHGRGAFTYIGKVSEVAESMARLFDQLEAPVLTDIALDWGGSAAQATYPARIPDLYLGEPVVFTARLSAPVQRVIVSGRLADTPWRTTLALQSGVTSPGVAALWARHKVDDLLDGLYHGDHAGEVKDAVIETALTHRLVTSYTSLVAVDVTPVRPPDADWQRGEVATNLPHGWSYEHVFGVDPQRLRPAQPSPISLRMLKTSQPGAVSGPAVIGLPQTATPAPLLALIALLALMAAAALWRRRA